MNRLPTMLLSLFAVCALSASAFAQSSPPIQERGQERAQERAQERRVPAAEQLVAPDATLRYEATCRADTSLDEFISDWIAAAESFAEEAPSRRELTAMFHAVDTDGDGQMSAAERRAGNGGEGGWVCVTSEGPHMCVCQCPG